MENVDRTEVGMQYAVDNFAGNLEMKRGRWPIGALYLCAFVGSVLAHTLRAQSPITEYPIPTTASAPEGIAAGPDGQVWFVENDGNKIGRITLGFIREFVIPTPHSGPWAIAAGPDGNV